MQDYHPEFQLDFGSDCERKLSNKKTAWRSRYLPPPQLQKDEVISDRNLLFVNVNMAKSCLYVNN